jgi:rhodanese-related sulfurtransferase
MKTRRSAVDALFWIVISLLSFSAACSAAEAPRISKEELKALLGHRDVVVLDARTEAAWKGSDKKIKDAVRVDPWNIDLWAGGIPKDKKIVVYCS